MDKNELRHMAVVAFEFDLSNIEKKQIYVYNKTKDKKIPIRLDMSDREILILTSGGILAYTKRSFVF